LAEAQELGKSAAELPAQVEGEDGLIILNHRYVLDCLNAIEEDQIKLKVVNDTSPTLILPQEDKEYMYLVMPIKT
jgi:DNA polymerase-3 subunit beta